MESERVAASTTIKATLKAVFAVLAELGFGGWIWRCDLEATGPSRTTVRLTYDWSAVPPEVRKYLEFPPFPPDHRDNSLRHLSDLVT